jgi:hypothetical protein
MGCLVVVTSVENIEDDATLADIEMAILLAERRKPRDAVEEQDYGGERKEKVRRYSSLLL